MFFIYLRSSMGWVSILLPIEWGFPFSGVTLLFTEPPYAHKPDIRWRLYVFKGGEVLNGRLCWFNVVIVLFFNEHNALESCFLSYNFSCTFHFNWRTVLVSSVYFTCILLSCLDERIYILHDGCWICHDDCTYWILRWNFNSSPFQ